jgi:hypothetical protein
VTAGSPVTLSGAGSSSANGALVKFEWDLNYSPATGFQVDATGLTVTLPTQQSTAETDRKVALRVTDVLGLAPRAPATSSRSTAPSPPIRSR